MPVSLLSTDITIEKHQLTVTGLGLAVAVFTVISVVSRMKIHNRTDAPVSLVVLDGARWDTRFVQSIHSSMGRCHTQPDPMARSNTREAIMDLDGQYANTG